MVTTESVNSRKGVVMRSKVFLVAAVAIATLALAGPAVARQRVHSVAYAHTLSAATMITVVCLAVAMAVALVAGVVLANRVRPCTENEETEPVQAPRVKQVSRQRQAVA
jgi:hypothetical protein